MFDLLRLYKTSTESDWKLLDAIKESKTRTAISVHIKLRRAVPFVSKFIKPVVADTNEDEYWKRVFESLSSGEIRNADDRVQLKDKLLWREGLLWIPESAKF